MSDFAYTRCPGCTTVFRVTIEQLAVREGQVRCGRCRAVFDANDHIVKVDAETRAQEVAAQQTPEVPAHHAVTPQADEAPIDDVAPNDATDATEAGTDAATDASDASIAATGAPVIATGAPVVATEAPIDPAADVPAHAPTDAATSDVLPRPREFEWRPRKRLREQPKALHALGLVVLVALLGVQLLFEYRDALAAHVPITRPLLEGACGVAGCEIEPLRDASALSIEASDLQSDPAHKGLLKLTATVRNRAAYPIAYPYLELTLTDAADAIVARRAFPPAVYVRAPGGGIAGNGEMIISMFLDASATAQAGYRLYLFYP